MMELRPMLMIATWIFSFQASAQQPLIFNDVHGLKGMVFFSGQWSDTALPKEGPFRMNWRNLNGDTLVTYRVNGQLKNHQPVGKWIWEEAAWNYQIEPGTGIEPVFKHSGTQHYWEGQFHDGMPHGKWLYQFGQAPLKSSGNLNALRMTGALNQGRFQGKFQIVDAYHGQKFKLNAQCNNEGTATGIWEFSWLENGIEVQEERHYEKGILTKLVRKEDKKTVNQLVFEKNLNYLALLQDTTQKTVLLSDSVFVSDQYPAYATDLLNTYFAKYFLHPWSHEAFPFQPTIHAPGFKRFIFPLTDTEIQLRDNAGSKIDETLAFVDEKLELGNVRINRARNATLDLAIAILEDTKERLIYLDSIIDWSHQTSFLYLNRDSGEMKLVLAKLNASSRAQGEVYDTSISLIAIQIDSVDFFLSIHRFLDDLIAPLQQAALVIEENVISIHKEGDLRLLENQMASMLHELDSLYTNATGVKQTIHQQWINTYLRNAIQDYAQTDDYETAKALGSSLMIQMDSLKNWSDNWALLDALTQELEIAYTQFAYNPYNGKYDIVLPLKKRFLTQAKGVVIPYLLSEIQTAQDWETLHEAYQQAIDMRAQLIRFATLEEKSDRRLERKLRKENQADRFIRQFLRYMEGR